MDWVRVMVHTVKLFPRSPHITLYWGETCRNGFKRGKEHQEGLEKEWEKAPLWRHARVFHGGVKEVDWYRMKVERTHRTPLV